MVIQKIETGEFKNRYLAEDMRSNKEVWIDEYFDKTQVNPESEEESRSIAALAQEVKKIHSSLIIYIHEVIENNNATYVIYDLPRGVRLKPLVKYDEKTVLEIGSYLVKALLSLQAHGVGVNNVPPEDIYLESHKDIHLLFGDWISLRSNKSNSDEEIKCIGNILYFLILGETPNNLDEVEGKLKAHCSDLVSNIIIRMLSDVEDQKFQRLEQIIPLVEEKKRVSAEVLIVSDDTEVSVSHKIYRSLIILFAVIFLYSVMYQPKSFTLKEISVFDKARFHILGYIGVEEAQRALGEIYEKGYGVKQDYHESIEWYKKAAQSGNVYAQMNLGHFYDKGIGVPLDRKQALYWFTLAATNGDKIAKENVALLNGSSKEEVDKKEIVKKEENSTKQDDENLKQDTTNNQATESIKNPANAAVEVSKQSIQGNEMFMDAENVPVGGSGGLEITNNQTVAQSFTTTHKGRLLAIDLIDLKIHRCLPKESLYVSLVNIQNGQLGAYSFFTRELHPNEVTNTTRLYFGSYGPMVNPGEQYAVFLQTKASGCTYAWGGEYETYDGGETFISTIPNKRDMKFRSFIRED